MQLMERSEFLLLPEGTVFARFYPELMTANYSKDDIRPRPFIDLCIKGKTQGQDFDYTSLTECVKHHDHVDHAERDHMALCYGATDCHFALDLESVHVDVPGGHTEPSVDQGREFPPRQLYAAWSVDEVDALAEKLRRARDHHRLSRGLEI